MTPSLTNTSVDADEARRERRGEMIRALRRGWRLGEQPGAEEFLNQQPLLWQQPEEAVELIYEEYCQRLAAGQDDVAHGLLRRFPQWAGPLQVMFECHQVLQADRAVPRFPAVGETVGEFRLVAELGRGAYGRVFLATQAGLADRPVVLKTTPRDGGEHVSLARLQHTNIVPLYSFLDDPERDLHVLCMPYFGRATLASLLEELANVPLGNRTGRHVVEVIDRLQEPPTPAVGAARQMLAQVTYVQAVSWIAACLADALQFAHERNLVHLDLKPSNVLLANDGQPMLLDFHLARAPIQPPSALPERFGGTPGYAAPEQQQALQALREGRPIVLPVDGRADVHALGALLHEVLGGALPTAPQTSSLESVNPQVSVGLADVVAKCLAERADDRYQSAAALADDLRRHLTDQPLAGVANRSVAERWRKWRRRQPGRLRAASALVVLGGAAALLLAGAWWHVHDRQRQAERALAEGSNLLHDPRHYAEAVRTLERGLTLTEKLPLRTSAERDLRERLATARQLHLAQQLRGFADEIRALYGADAIPPDRRHALLDQCGLFWEKRRQIMEALSSTHAPNLANDLQDVAIFTADLHLRSSGSADAASRQTALRILDEAEALFGGSAVLDHVRQEALGTAETRDVTPQRSGTPRSAWEGYALGRAYLAAGDLQRANESLVAALKIDPPSRWGNYYHGLCSYRGGRYEDALAAFSICIGTAPQCASCYANRGLVYAALGRPELALQDYDHALRLDPTLATAARNRGLLHFGRQQYVAAIADLTLALEHQPNDVALRCDLAMVHAAANDPAAALTLLRQALERDPHHGPARELLGALQSRAAGAPSKSR